MNPLLGALLPIFVGLAVALLIYGIAEFVRAVPKENREYRDQPPRLFRLFWPLVLIASHYGAGLVTPEYRTRTTAKLQRAGMEYALTAEQFFAGKIVSGIVYGVVTWFLGAMALDSDDLTWPLLLGAFGFMYPDLWLRDTIKRRNLAILKGLPFFLDIVTLSVEAGLNLTGALQQASTRCPPGPLMVEINRLLREIRAGRPRQDAMRDMATRLDYAPVASFVSALIQGELTGSSLGPILRAQSEQRRNERFQRAEKLAMEAPVKMLGPLIMFIFPCTFIIIFFPIVIKFMNSGL